MSGVIPNPSLSRTDNAVHTPPLAHSFLEKDSSVLSLSSDENYLYSGSQSRDISVWDKKTFHLKTKLRGHTGSILALEYAPDKQWLFSGSGDSTVRIWSTERLDLIYILSPYLETGAGDLFSLVWSSSLQTLFIGCQNTSLQFFSFEQLHQDASGLELSGPNPNGPNGIAPIRIVHRFFDSYPQYERKPADIYAANPGSSYSSMGSDDGMRSEPLTPPRAYLHVPSYNVIDSAHYGYIYCMALLPSSRDGSDDNTFTEKSVQLVTGSGDETIKLWDCSTHVPSLLHTFECSHGAVLSLVVRGNTVYAGCQDGYVMIWDLETRTLVRTIIVQENVDILSLSMMHSDLYTSSANGVVQCWSASFDCIASWSAHDGIALSSIVSRSHSAPEKYNLFTGGNDGFIKMWQIEPPNGPRYTSDSSDAASSLSLTHDTLTYALGKFVSIPSVSSLPQNREDCRQAAIWLKKCFSQLGADAHLLPTGDGTNPLVSATFSGARSRQQRPRILFYGHYDVIAAPTTLWDSEPFTLTGINGFLHGRGATDNKGPILATAFAAAELLQERALDVDLVFLIEGEEEHGSIGFEAAVKEHKQLIGDIDAILISNSTWITEDTPCVTYGLRGVVHCAVEISNHGPDLHSGVDGGVTAEPMSDMLQLLASLSDSRKRIRIPKFYDNVRPMTETERTSYALLSHITQRSESSLSSRWREPSLSVHNIAVSGPKNETVIPATVTAHVSIRIVPDQNLTVISNALLAHIETTFGSLDSPNKLKLDITHVADWWLGDLDDPWFKALEQAVHNEWGVEPLRIREGGSIPSIPFLEKELGCRALHLPLGQSTDQAHLPNERISVSNLYKGKSVIKRFLRAVAEGPMA